MESVNLDTFYNSTFKFELSGTFPHKTHKNKQIKSELQHLHYLKLKYVMVSFE